MELISSKILVLTLLGAMRLFFGLIPLKVTRYLEEWGQKSNRRLQVEVAISICLCFGGGVLLATCFIHMIPEVRESLMIVRQSGGLEFLDASFPLAELLICCGFFLVYILEESAHFILLRSDKKAGDSPTCVAHVDPEMAPQNGNCAETPPWCGRSAKIMPTQSQIQLLSPTFVPEQSSPPLQHDIHANDQRERSLPSPKLTVVPDQSSRVDNLNANACNKGTADPSNHHHNLCLESAEHRTLLDNLRNFLVVIALSFHSVFEGLAIGLQPTQHDVWYMFTAVSIHAVAIVFCIGLELAASGAKRSNIVTYMVILAMVSPLGVLIGILVTSQTAVGSVIQSCLIAVLQGIAGGTILYITFFEVLDRERKKQVGCSGVRIFSILLGFCLMVALQITCGHNHTYGERKKIFSESPGNSSHDHLNDHDHK